MNQKNIDVINICLDMMETFGNEKSKADIKEAKEALRGMVEQNEVLADTVSMLSPLMMENKNMKTYIRNGVELGYIDDREGDYKKYLQEGNPSDG